MQKRFWSPSLDDDGLLRQSAHTPQPDLAPGFAVTEHADLCGDGHQPNHGL
jgi:hypothetical protein